jgi:hypothetical protein
MILEQKMWTTRAHQLVLGDLKDKDMEVPHFLLCTAKSVR